MPVDAMRWRGIRAALLYVAAWTPLVLVYAVLIGVTSRLPTSSAIVAALQSVLPAAVLGLVVVHVTRNDRPTAPLRAPFVVRHTLYALLYAVSWSAAILVNLRMSFGTWSAAWQDAASWVGWQTVYGVILYLVIASIQWIITSQRSARDEERRRQQLEVLQVRSELEALRGRLDPHFLFNTLHSVSVLVQRDPEVAERALGQLADLLRYILDSKRGGREHVALAEEVQFVETYLALESLRFGSRLRVERALDEDALDCVVPSLTLQPLVENAIKHAIAPRAAGGTVSMTASIVGDTLELAVRDDGPPGAVDSGFGVGLDALTRRLRLLYGDAANVRAEREDTGFAVTVRMPA